MLCACHSSPYKASAWTDFIFHSRAVGSFIEFTHDGDEVVSFSIFNFIEEKNVCFIYFVLFTFYFSRRLNFGSLFPAF